MRLTLFEQGEVFRFAFLFGVGLGMVYDVFRLIRAMGFVSKRAVFLQDTMFMSICGVLCFLFAQGFLHGHFRLYAMLGHLLGFTAYRTTIGAAASYLYRPIGALYRRIVSLLDHIVFTIVRIMYKSAIWIRAICHKICEKTRKYSEI